MSAAPAASLEKAGGTPSPPALTESRAPHKWLVAIAVMIGATLEVLDTSIVNVSLPHMQGSFSASRDEVTWILTSYLVAKAIMMETFPPEEQGLAMSVWGMGMLTSPMLGPTLGGWITYNWNWRWNFYINLPIGILAAIMVTIFVHDPEYIRKSQARARRIDYWGIIYLALGLGLLQIVLDRGQRADWFNSAWVCIFTAVAVVALILLVYRELHFSEPILDLRIMAIPLFDVSVMLILIMMLVVFGMNLLNPLFFQELLGYSPWKSGIAVLPRGFGTLAGMFLIGQLSRRGV